uniref:Uncharacterized protein n=1 Tax=Zea mays TaxID=4577 RepID=C0PL57_MAIZE|nr:unknown [Zea mays]
MAWLSYGRLIWMEFGMSRLFLTAVDHMSRVYVFQKTFFFFVPSTRSCCSCCRIIKYFFRLSAQLLLSPVWLVGRYQNWAINGRGTALKSPENEGTFACNLVIGEATQTLSLS